MKTIIKVFGAALLVASMNCAMASNIGGIEIGGSGAKGFVYEYAGGYGLLESDEIRASEVHVVSPAKEFVSQNQRVVSALHEEMIPQGDIDRIADGVAKIYEEFNRRNDKLSGLYLVGSSSVEKNRNTSELAKAVLEKVGDPTLKLEFISHGQEAFYGLFDAIYGHRNSGMCSPYNNSIILGLDSEKSAIATHLGKVKSFNKGLGEGNEMGAEIISAIKSLVAEDEDINVVYLTTGKSVGFPGDVLNIAGQINRETGLPVRFAQDDNSDEIIRRVHNMVERSKELAALSECATLENSAILDIGAGNAKLGYLDKSTRTYTLHSHEIPYGTATLSSYIANRSDEMCFTMPDTCGVKADIPTLVDMKKTLLHSHPRLFEETSKGYRNIFVVGGTSWAATKITRLNEIFNDYSCINLDDIENLVHDTSPLRTLLKRSLRNAIKDVDGQTSKHIDEYHGQKKTAFLKKMRDRKDAMSAEVEKVLSVYPMNTDELRSGALLTYWIFNELSDSSYKDRLRIRQQLNQLAILFNGDMKSAADMKNHKSLKRARVAFDAHDYEQAKTSVNGVVARLTGTHIGKLIRHAEKRLADSLRMHTRNTSYRVDRRIVRQLLNLADDRVAHGDLMNAYYLLSDANAAIIDPASTGLNRVGTCQTHEGTSHARQFLVPNRVNDWLRWHIMNREGLLIDALKYMGLIDLNFLVEPELRAQFVPEYEPTISKRSRDIQRDY